MSLLYAGFNLTSTNNSISTTIINFIHPRSLIMQLWSWLADRGHYIWDWLQQPHVLALIMAWWITFTVVLVLCLAIGFGPVGVGAGTLAAAFQSLAYGAFTPAGGIFATLTSMGMIGSLEPQIVGVAAGVACVVTVLVWAWGVGS